MTSRRVVKMLLLNSSGVSSFTLAAYLDLGPFKPLCFLLLLSFYAAIVCSNVLLIVVICVNRSLHEPMYLFLCSLFVNELYGSTGLFPFLLLQILSDVHTVSASCCFLQIFCLYSYGVLEFCSLAVMSYDRYLAICCPLQYGSRMTRSKIAALISAAWLFSSVVCAVPLCLSAPLQLCGNIINKVYCDNYFIVRQACSDTTVNNVYGLIGTAVTVFCPLSMMLYAYAKILKICFSGSRQMRQKAVSTCSPHLASLLNFSFGCFFEIVQSRFNMRHVPQMLRVFLSLYWLTCQPLLNPLLYGLNLSSIRNTCRSLIWDWLRASNGGLHPPDPRVQRRPGPT